jgi:hypothetical protein
VRATSLEADGQPVFDAFPGADDNAHGYPAAMITDTAFYRNDRYHTARDTPDTLDYRRMAEVVRAVHRAVLTLAR